ncbi:MAG: hypothetical protein Q9219_001558 [cf. Caloplaca sp. 3 TL-2023]
MGDTSPRLSSYKMNYLLVILIVLCVTLIVLGLVLIALRSHRRKKQQQDQSLPLHNPSAKRSSNHRRLTISAPPYVRDLNEKEALSSPASSEPPSPVPEIRITFPEEEDDSGKRKSGRVVIVRISETGGVGLEPYHDEHPPPYGKGEAGSFQSLDLERIGGLTEVQIKSDKA